MHHPIDGFWLPREARRELLDTDTPYSELSFLNGRECRAGTPGAVTARWPRLAPQSWERLSQILQENRRRIPQGQAYWERLAAALQQVAGRLSDPQEALHRLAMQALPVYTGYSAAMIGATLNSMEMMSLGDMPAAYTQAIDGRAIGNWRPLAGLPGRLRFYPGKRLQGLAFGLPGLQARPLFKASGALDLVVGYGAGNVPGTALMIALLAGSTTMSGQPAPATVIKNSRREPIFSALVLEALEEADPDLTAGTAVLVWDYQEQAIQELLLGRADLVIAAASDETIAQLAAQIEAAGERRQKPAAPRFQAHGHKVSFSAIGAEMLSPGLEDPASGADVIEIVSLLATLDSIFWDQHGCLSSRVHFVEKGGAGHHSPLEYAQRVKAHLETLSKALPRGAWPLGQIHDRFDRYKSLEASGAVRALSKYEDEFLVVLDERPLSGTSFYSLVNDCQGRVIFVRPVEDLTEVPRQYLRMLPPQNLQSLSVAVGRPGEGLGTGFLDFAEACGRRGVTAIRTVGRGAFPQLSYSWDGLIPLDLIQERMQGHFTTIEFDRPYEQILQTYQQYLARGQAIFSGA